MNNSCVIGIAIHAWLRAALLLASAASALADVRYVDVNSTNATPPNGNTLVNNWFNEWSGTLDRSNPPVQAVEFTADKTIVWVLRSWEKPDLGPATTIQILNESSAPDHVSFGEIR